MLAIKQLRGNASLVQAVKSLPPQAAASSSDPFASPIVTSSMAPSGSTFDFYGTPAVAPVCVIVCMVMYMCLRLSVCLFAHVCTCAFAFVCMVICLCVCECL